MDFGSTAGNVHITDSGLSGSAYGENIGWIDLSTVTNTSEGVLSGYAWGENVGFVDFSKVTIGTDGVFSGSAYAENIGWITFGTENNKILTDYRPLSARPVISSGGPTLSSVIVSPTTETITPVIIQAPTLPPPIIPIIPTTNPPTDYPISPPQTNVEPLIYDFGTTVLKNGSQGEAVKELQRFLNDKLNLGLAVDGILGPNTIAVIKQWQEDKGLVADGLVGPATKGLMN